MRRETLESISITLREIEDTLLELGYLEHIANYIDLAIQEVEHTLEEDEL